MAVSKAFWKTLNGGWPEGMNVPTDKEAIHGVKLLWRHVTGKPWGRRVKVARGQHHRTWTRSGVLIVAPDYHYPKPGWPAICHDLSHLLHSRMPYDHRPRRPHDSRQARIEKTLQNYVIERLVKS